MLGIFNVYCEGEEDLVILILYDVFVLVLKLKKNEKCVLFWELFIVYKEL